MYHLDMNYSLAQSKCNQHITEDISSSLVSFRAARRLCIDVWRLNAPWRSLLLFLFPAVSLLWSEDVGTGARVWSLLPNPSRSGAASRVDEGWRERTSSARWTSWRRSSTPTSLRSMRSLKTRQRSSWSWSCECLLLLSRWTHHNVCVFIQN